MSSNNTDRRVVEMYFDNKDFEKNARESIRTMGELNDSLNMTSSAKNMNKSLSEINSNTSILAATTATLGKQWSAWEVVAITAIQRITNRVIDLGEQMVKSLTVDQYAAGFDKYNEYLGNTSTLLAQGFDLSTVENQLDKLLKYTDATSYNFTDMANNIGKFTATGQGLEESVTAMMGIANWAALSGQNAQKASQAMYQLSQAMSSGYIRYQDWRSIQQYNMDTEQFRKKAVELAEIEGTLYKIGDDLYRTQEGHEYSLSQLFKDGLSDNWFTSDVLMKTTEKFAFAYNETLKMVENTGDKFTSTYEAFDTYKNLITAISDGTDLQPVIKQFEDAGIEAEVYMAEIERLKEAMTDEQYAADAIFGVTSQKAAQEFRKFEDIQNALKDAISSTWMSAFQNLVGGAEEAKKVWSNIYDYLEPIFMAIPSAVEKITKAWNVLGGREDLFSDVEGNLGAVYQTLQTLNDIFNMFKESFVEVFFGIDSTATDTTQQLANKFKKLTESFKRISQAINKYIIKHSGTIKNIIKIVFNGIKMIINVVRIGLSLVKSVVTGLKPLLGLLGGGSGGLLNITEKLNDKLEKFINTSKVFEKITNILARATGKLVAKIKELNIIDHIQSGFDKFKTALANNGKTVESLKRIWAGLKVVFTTVGNYILKILPKLTSVLGKGLSKGLNYLAQGIGYLADKFAEAIEAFNKWRTKPQTVERWGKVSAFVARQLNNLGNALKYVGSRAINLVRKINWKGIQNVLSGIWKVVRKLTKTVYNFGKALIQSGLSKAMNVISKAFTDTKNAITETGDSLDGKSASKFTKFASKLKKTFKPLITMFKALKDVVLALARVLTQIFALIAKTLNGIAKALSKIPNIFNNKKFQEIFGKFKGMGAIKQIAIIAGLILIVKVLRDALSVLTIASAISDSIFALSKFLRAKAFYMVAAGIKMIVTSLISIAAAVALLGTIKVEVVRNGIKHMSEIAGLMTLFIGTLLLLLKVFGDKTVLKSSGKLTLFGKAFKKEGKSEYTAMTQMARTVTALAAAMTSIAVALSLMILPVKILGKMNDNVFTTGMERVTRIVALLSIYTVILARSAKTKKGKTEIDPNFVKRISKSLTGLIVSIVGLSFTINKIGKLKADTFERGFKRIVEIMSLVGAYQVALTLVTKDTAKSKNGVYSKKDSNAEAITAVSKSILATALAMVGLVYAVKQFGKLDGKTFAKGVGAIAIMFTGFSVLAISLSKFAKFIGAKKVVEGVTSKKSVVNTLADIGILLMGISTALLGVSLSMYILNKLGKDQLERSAKILGVILGSLLVISGLIALYSKKNKFNSESQAKKESLKITAIIGAIASLGAVFAMLSMLSESQLRKASIAMSVLVGALGATFLALSAINKLNYGKSVSENMLKKNTKLIYMIGVIAGAIGLLAVSMKMLGKASVKELVKGGLAMLAIVGIISAALVLFVLINKIPGNVSTKSIGLLTAMAVSLSLLAMAFIKLGKMSWKAIGKGVTIIAILAVVIAALTALGAAASVGSVGIAAVAAIIGAIGVALLSFAYALQVLNKIDVKKVIKNLDAMLSWFKENWSSVIAGITAMSAAIVGGIIGAIVGAIPGVIAALGELISGIFEWCAKHSYELMMNFIKFIVGAIEAIADNFGDIGNAILKLFRKIVIFLTTDVPYTFGKTMTSAGFTFIKYFIKGMADGIKETSKIGEWLIEGFKDGINTAWGSFKKFWNKLVAKIPGTWANFLKIGSPSKLMKQYGEWTIEGLNIGMEKEADKTENVMTDVAKSIVGSIDDTNLTLTPVIDLSEIQNGTSQMARMMNSVNGASVSATMASNTMSSVESSRAANIRAAQQTQIQPAGNENITLNNTFNITGEADPNEIADTVSKKIAEQITRRKTAWQ